MRQVWGNIVAPEGKSAWKASNTTHWLSFKQINGLFINGHGQGQIDGRGSSWWRNVS